MRLCLSDVIVNLSRQAWEHVVLQCLRGTANTFTRLNACHIFHSRIAWFCQKKGTIVNLLITSLFDF